MKQKSNTTVVNYLTAVFVLLTSFLIVPAFLLSGCGGSSIPIPIEDLKKKLQNQPTFSVVLDDMQEQGTFSKTFFHKYLVVQPEGSWKTDFLQVPENYYQKNLSYLGMTLLTKKDGAFDETPSPPGYGFVGDPAYGRWKEDKDGGSFWEFYGKYAFFTSLFGGWYHPVYRMDFDGYKKYKSKKKPYFGSKMQFGSTGKIVKQKNPGFYASRTAAASIKKASFKDKVISSKIGRTKTGFRSRAGGKGK